MTNICVSGSAGRMGRTLVQAAQQADFIRLASALEDPASGAVGADSGTVAGIGPNHVLIDGNISQCEFDVIIEFTSPDATIDHLGHCLRHGRKMVIGTTGFSSDQLDRLQDASREIAIVHAPNMSAGVNICLNLVRLAAQAFGDSVDIEVIEAHHSRKVDAPSGTALRLGEVAAEELGRTLDVDGVFARHGQTGPRERKSIGFATIRAGDIIGEHTVMFAGEGERVEITHRSNSRMNYAMGAMRAAHWLMDKPAGIYDMHDVLGLK